MTEISRQIWRRFIVFAPRTLTVVSVIISVAICFVGLVIFNGMAIDFLGLPVDPWLVLIAVLLELILIFSFLSRRHIIRITLKSDELFGFLLIIGVVSAYLIIPSLPGGLPPSHHFDAVNHILLTDFIFNQNALPHDMSGTDIPYFMNWYPAGGALLAAEVSHWIGSIPFRTLHLVASLILGLSAGIVFVLTNRLLPDRSLSKPVSFLASILLFTSWNYFPGLVNERYVYAQVISQFFALSAFFFAYLYWVEPDLFALCLASFAAGIAFVSHPTAVVAAIAVPFGTIVLHPRISGKRKIAHGLVFFAGMLPIICIYVVQHLPYWTRLTGYGEAIPFTPESIGLFLPILGVIGIGLVLRSGRKYETWFPLLLLAAILFQPIALLILRPFIQGIETQFFERSVYLLIYPLAILSGFPLLRMAERLLSYFPNFNMQQLIVWVATLAASLAILIFLPPHPFAPLTSSELTVAFWAKQHIDLNNIAVVSPIREDAYWIHLAIFNHSPSNPLTTAAYEIGPMDYGEWRGNPGEPDYAIVRNMSHIPNDPTVTTVYRVDESAILLKPRALIAAIPARQHATDIHFGDMFDLKGYDLAGSNLLGEPLSVTFYWQPLHWPSARVAMFVQVLDSLGTVVARSENEMLQKRYPTQRWPIGNVVTDTWTVPLPADASAGDYTLEIAVFDKFTGNRFPVSDSNGEPTDRIELGPVRMAISPPSDAELKSANQTNERFGNEISLLAYSVASRRVAVGRVLDLTLYWERIASITRDYTVFVHLLDSSGHLVAQIDAAPQNGTYPTSAWQSNEVVKDPYHLQIPKDLLPGDYKIEVGLYTAADLKRVPVAGSDQIILPQSLTVQ